LKDGTEAQKTNQMRWQLVKQVEHLSLFIISPFLNPLNLTTNSTHRKSIPICKLVEILTYFQRRAILGVLGYQISVEGRSVCDWKTGLVDFLQLQFMLLWILRVRVDV
jgi:hypothetical protein